MAGLAEGETARTSRLPVQSRRNTCRSRICGVARRHESTGTTSWERYRRSPARPARVTAKRIRVRQPRPSSSSGRDSTLRSLHRSGASPPRRTRLSRITDAFNAPCASSEACCQSQPPQTPAYGQGGITRSADGRSTDSVSARTNRPCFGASVTRTRTRSPGRQWRTNSTWPSCRPIHTPPCATAVISTSTTSPRVRRWSPSADAE